MELDPLLAAAWFGAGEAFEKQGDQARAAAHYQKAAELEPRLAIARRAWGRLELAQGKLAAGIAHLRAVVELEPQAAVARAELAAALAADGQIAEAIAQLRRAVELDPDTPAENDLAWILATAPDDALRNGAQAVPLAQHACRAPHDAQPERLDTLAAAYAEMGQFDRALQSIDRAVELARAGGQAELVKTLLARRELYASQRPYRDSTLKRRAP
jgi:tetratricopeptide (TPR) repeat protein